MPGPNLYRHSSILIQRPAMLSRRYSTEIVHFNRIESESTIAIEYIDMHAYLLNPTLFFVFRRRLCQRLCVGKTGISVSMRDICAPTHISQFCRQQCSADKPGPIAEPRPRYLKAADMGRKQPSYRLFSHQRKEFPFFGVQTTATENDQFGTH